MPNICAACAINVTSNGGISEFGECSQRQLSETETFCFM